LRGQAVRWAAVIVLDAAPVNAGHEISAVVAEGPCRSDTGSEPIATKPTPAATCRVLSAVYR
jgi:hypothetical protein